jgi:hypothetical protein
LHVLSAPPALILSRDQTLIYTCECLYAPACTQSSDEFVFVASNQIVKDLRAPNGSLAISARTRASKLAAAPRQGRDMTKTERISKRAVQEGRIPLRAVARAGVLLPILFRGSISLYHVHALPYNHILRASALPQEFGDSPRIPEVPRDTQGDGAVFCRKFL